MARKKPIACGITTISLSDESLIEGLNKLLPLPEYNNNFSKLVSELLSIGLEVVLSRDDEKELEPVQESKPISQNNSDMELQIVEFMEELVKLTKENIVYSTMMKSMLCSLFNGKALELGGQPIPKKKFEDGAYRRTPSYLETYEVRSFKNIRGD